ncbi:DNA polymerase/3'-5' exonuclease PolX [Ralstonia phage RP13]|nr:DNA polymerase/3'-5' exonuclease PolX [Ralstonia phage RP13]
MKVRELVTALNRMGDFYANHEDTNKQGKRFSFYKAARSLKTQLGMDTEADEFFDFTVFSGIGDGIQDRLIKVIKGEWVYELANAPGADPIQHADKELAEKLAGFGIKTQSDVVDAMMDKKLCHVLPDELIESNGRIRRDKVEGVMGWLRHIIQELGEGEMIPLGSYRRESPTVKDLDFIVVDIELDKLMNIIRTTTPLLVREVTVGELMRRTVIAYNGITVAADFKMVPKGTEGTAILHFTGPVKSNIVSRAIVKRQGGVLNEYGVFVDGSEVSSTLNMNETQVIEFLNEKYGTNIPLDPASRS